MKVGRVALLLTAATALQFFVGGSRHRSAWPVDCFLIATAVVARGGDPAAECWSAARSVFWKTP